MSERKNFPEPKTNADRIALKAAELLDQDVWERVTDSSIWVRGIRIWWTEYDRFYVDVDESQDADALKNEQVSSPIAEIFQTAKNGALSRKRFTLLVPKLAQISNDAWERVRAAEARRIFWRQARKVAAWVIVSAIALTAAVGGIASCVKADEVAREADLNQVNEYGFRKGDFAPNYRLEYPKSCATVTNPIGNLRECRERFERWEKSGGNWIDWESAP
jgi:hypothetical protein